MKKTIHTRAYQELIFWLKENREKQGLSMRDLAAELGVSHSWVGKIEQMERRLDICEYVRLCQALGIDPGKGLNRLKAQLK